MQRMMLIGPSQCGKTSLTQCLRGEDLQYQKTQAIVWSPATIDTPGEYLENRSLYKRTAGQRLRSGHYRAGAKCGRTVVTFFARFYHVNESPGHWDSNQSGFSQRGTTIFGEMLVTGSWSAQRVSDQCG